MTISTDYIVLLWLLPVTLFIIVPLTAGAGWLAVAAVRDITRGRIPFMGDYAVRSYSASGGVQKRREQRQYLPDPIPVTLVNGGRSASGFIADFSMTGLCIEGITETIATSGEYLKLLVEKAGKRLSIQAEPRWVLAGEDSAQTSGMRVVGDLTGWNYFVTGN